MDDSLTCRFPGCGYSTTSQIPAEEEHLFHSQLFVLHIRFYHPPKEASVSTENAALPAVKLSKAAKKRRRKKGSSYQTKVVDSDENTASMEGSQSDSVVPCLLYTSDAATIPQVVEETHSGQLQLRL